MVRRAEYALGKAIRAGQERGEILSRHNTRGGVPTPGVKGSASRTSLNNVLDDRKSPTEFAPLHELTGNDRDGIYAMVDGVTEPEFDAAIDDAKAEGNLSRANVVRKIKGVKSEGLTPVEKLAKIRELAPRGYTSACVRPRSKPAQKWTLGRFRSLPQKENSKTRKPATRSLRQDPFAWPKPPGWSRSNRSRITG